MKVLSDILHKAGVLKENAEGYSSGGYSVLVRNSTTQRVETVPSSSLVPDQSGNSGKYLTTDGANLSWGTITGGTGAAGQVTYWTGTNTQSGSNNLFWDNANVRLGIGTTTPLVGLHISKTVGASVYLQDSDALSTVNITELTNTSGNFQIITRSSTGSYVFDHWGITVGSPTNSYQRFFTSGTEVMRLHSTGNLALQNGGTFTDSGQRLQVNGDTLLKGSGNTSATSALLIQNSAGTAYFRAINDGRLQIGSDAHNAQIFPFSTTQAPSLTSRNLMFYSTNGTQVASEGRFKFDGTSFVQTSGTVINVESSSIFEPTSGTATFQELNLSPQVSQSGGANGISRGLYVAPILTAAADWRSIEWSNNSGWGLYGAGTSDNYLGGSLGIGTNAATTSRLNIKGSGTTGTTQTIYAENSDGTQRLSFSDSGLFSVGGTTTSDSGVTFRFVGNSTNSRLGVYDTNKVGVYMGAYGGTTSIYAYNYTSGTGLNLRINEFGGNVLVGGTTDSGQRLQVTGDTLLKGSGNTSGSTALTVQNSDGTNMFRIRNDNRFLFGAQNAFIATGDTVNTSSTSGSIFYITSPQNFDYTGKLGIGVSIASRSVSGSTAVNSQILSITESESGYNPTSGSLTRTYLQISALINQTGGANGITRGLYVNPTLTAASDWRSIEWSNNSGWGLYGAGTSNNYLAGALGIGSTTLTQRKIGIGGNTVGAGFNYGIHSIPVIQSDVTNYLGFNSEPSTQATSFTLTTLRHFSAIQGTFGIGSSVSVQAGFWANSSLTGATNNYGFYGDIAAATGRWNLYMNGTANNYMAGSLGIGSTSLTGSNIVVSKQITGAASSSGIRVDGTIQSDVTGTASYYRASISQASGFTTSVGIGYWATQGSISGTINSQIGFYADNMTSGVLNVGFYGNISAASLRFNLYMAGSASNFLEGSLGIGSVSLGGHNLRVSKNITGSIIGYGVYNDGQVQSDVTSSVRMYTSRLNIVNSTFTIPNAYHYLAEEGTLGATATVTNQYGFVASNFTKGTNNYGFYGELASATGKWNLYMIGTASNYLAGNLYIADTTIIAGNNYHFAKAITGSTALSAMINDGVVQSDVTSIANNYNSTLRTQATTFTLTEYRHYLASQATLGAGSLVTNQYGFYASSALVGATNDYGFYGDIASGTGRWNIYMNGTASNYMAGNVLIGSSTDGGEKLQVTGNAVISGQIGIGVTTPNYVVDVYSTTGPTTVYFRNGASSANGFTNMTLSSSGGTVSHYAYGTGIASSIFGENYASMYYILAANTGAYVINKSNNYPFIVATNATERFRIAGTGEATFSSSIKTGVPTGGTAQPWKLGQYNATSPTATGYVEVEVNGVLYKLLAST